MMLDDGGTLRRAGTAAAHSLHTAHRLPYTASTMAETIENLLLEHMKRFQATIDRVERKCDELIVRMGQVESGIAGLRRDFAHSDENIAILSVRMDRIGERIDRIEQRLDLA
ncbi:MAG: hypothetical protein QM750_13235 [Rubrivivax sp.]